MNENFEKREETPRSILSKLIKEELIASQSMAYGAEEREKSASKAIEELLIKHPELVDEVDKIQERRIKQMP